MCLGDLSVESSYLDAQHIVAAARVRQIELRESVEKAPLICC